LIKADHLSLAVPLEARVKSLESISEKLLRKPQEIDCVTDLADFVGIRAILLFRRDADTLGEAITKHFTILQVEDTSTRLSESEFGYQSRHYQVRIPSDWLAVPSFAEFADMRAEIQVRTAAQHIWAATSHLLQYKKDRAVPPVLRRSIYRLSALLETVDLEFERLLEDRRGYIEEVSNAAPDQSLDVDVLKNTLDRYLPALNKDPHEPYAELLDELAAAGIRTTTEFGDLASKHLEPVIKREQAIVKGLQKARESRDGTVRAIIDGIPVGTQADRIRRGVFLSHAGFVRNMLRQAK
jgi:ppGpp synthetase/RelA/SpoT-type nucleotidyltranferase